MSYYLFLDDERKPSDVTWLSLPENVEWVVVKSYEDFVSKVNVLGVPKFITYDCDLCEEHYRAYHEYKHLYAEKKHLFKTKCGIHCAAFMIDFCMERGLRHPEFEVHSMNIYGKEYISKLINKYGKN